MLSYLVPDRIEDQVRPGAAVVVPLSGYSRLGIVVDVCEKSEHSREYIHEVVDDLSITPGLCEACCRLSELFAVPMPSVLRLALPPGLNASRYRIVDPAPDWTWKAGSMISRSTLKRELGGEGLKAAEDEGRLSYAVPTPDPKYCEWASVRDEVRPDLSRAPRQKQVYESLLAHGGEQETSDLLSETGASRGILRGLESREAIRLEKRPQEPPILSSNAARFAEISGYTRDGGRVVDRGGAWVWRVPTREQPAAVAACVSATIEGGEQALVLTPEIQTVEHLTRFLSETLPAGYTVAPFHSQLDRQRALLYDKARSGEIDVVVGTRTATLLPMKRLGAVCVVDEPNDAHRAEPGYEGLPIHSRDIALQRSKAEDCGVVFISPAPTLQIAASVTGTKELPARAPSSWPETRVVDMRKSGALLSSALIDVCQTSVAEGNRTVLLANRLGYATSVTCDHCGSVKSCPNCDLPLALRKPRGELTCGRCGHREVYVDTCAACGSERIRPNGFAIERLRQEISRHLDVPIGTISAHYSELENAQVVVATAPFVSSADWAVVLVPDVDTLLQGTYMGATQRAFRLVFGAAQAATSLVLVQTRQPDHYALRAALQGDYPAFAELELPRLRRLGYPPYGHLATLVLEGKESAMRRAVELRLRPALDYGVRMSAPIPLARRGADSVWRVLLRSPDQLAVARVGARIVRMATKLRGAEGLKVRVEIDPEEV